MAANGAETIAAFKTPAPGWGLLLYAGFNDRRTPRDSRAIRAAESVDASHTRSIFIARISLQDSEILVLSADRRVCRRYPHLRNTEVEAKYTNAPLSRISSMAREPGYDRRNDSEAAHATHEII